MNPLCNPPLRDVEFNVNNVSTLRVNSLSISFSLSDKSLNSLLLIEYPKWKYILVEEASD